MGNCVTNSKDLQADVKCHVIVYKWKGNTDMINFSSKDSEFTTSDYLLTKSGFFLVDTDRNSTFNWLKDYTSSARTNKLPSFRVQLNESESRLPNQIINISANQENFNNCMWQLINFEKNNLSGKGVDIEEGDIIKFGKQVMRFKIINSKQYPKSMKNLSSVKKIPNNVQSMMELHHEGPIDYNDMCNSLVFKEDELLCRVCLEPESPKNPFHDLCICNKTMPTHLSCFRSWLHKNSTVSETNNITFYNFMNITCEICKTQFSSSVKINGKEEPILEPKLPEDIPYAFVEVFQIEDPSKIKAFLIIDLSKDRKITIGRNEENDIIFKNNSISRNHCTIKIEKAKLKIVDQNSKFGTFKLLKSSIDIKPKKNTLFKTDRYLVEIHPFEKKPCECIKEKDTKDLQINPYKHIDEFAVQIPKRVHTMNDLDRVDNPIRDMRKKDKVKDLFRQKPVTLDYIPESEELVEENRRDSKNNTIKSNKLGNTQPQNQAPINLKNSVRSIEELMEDEINNSIKQSDGSFRRVLKDNVNKKPSNFHITASDRKKETKLSFESLEDDDSSLISGNESGYVFN